MIDGGFVTVPIYDGQHRVSCRFSGMSVAVESAKSTVLLGEPGPSAGSEAAPSAVRQRAAARSPRSSIATAPFPA